MIHAYASIWQCLMQGIMIEIREKACVHAHHTNKQKRQPLYIEYMKGEKGFGDASPPPSPKKPTE